MEVPSKSSFTNATYGATNPTHGAITTIQENSSGRGRANTFSGAINSCNLGVKTNLGVISPVFPSSIISKGSSSESNESSPTRSGFYAPPEDIGELSPAKSSKPKGMMAIIDLEPESSRGNRGCGGYVNYGTTAGDLSPTDSACNLFGAVVGAAVPGLPHNDRSTTNLMGHLTNESDYIESPWLSLKQIILPFLIAGFGNVAAGIVLDRVQHWNAFIEVPALLILVPALLGLKGNVEMTLASRLSTHANLGHMDSKQDLKKLIYGNMSLVQCQASVVGFIAPLVAIGLSYLHPDREEERISFENAVMMVSSSVITANIANLLLGTLMCAVVMLSRKCNINPDNVATPIAASLGDFTTMFLLAFVASGLHASMAQIPWLSSVLLASLLLLTPIWAYIARSIEFTKKVVATGWFPIIGAMLLQNGGGLIMERALEHFERLAAFQPVINGIGGNLCAIQSSRISTFLHQVAEKRQLPMSDPKPIQLPHKVYFGKSPHAMMARLLLCISLPSHLLFMHVIKLLKGHFTLTAPFILLYMAVVFIHVAILLYLAYNLVHFLWSRGMDPDNNAIPILTAVADLLGSALLALAFIILLHLGDENSKPFIIDENSVISSMIGISNATESTSLLLDN